MRPLRGSNNMQNKTDQVAVNPYESPRSTPSRSAKPGTSQWVGPLLSLCVLSMNCAIFAAFALLSTENRGILFAFTLFLVGCSVLSLTASFRQYRRAKRTPVHSG